MNLPNACRGSFETWLLLTLGCLVGCQQTAPAAPTPPTTPAKVVAAQPVVAAPTVAIDPAATPLVPVDLKPAIPATEPVAEAVKFPLEYRIVDPDNKDNANIKAGEKKLPPLIVMFPDGKTVDQADATGAIGRLEGFRGKSVLLPASNDNPGLPVVLSGLRFLERRDENDKVVGYEVELQGEFNAVKVPAPEAAMKDFLAGKTASFALEAKLNYVVIATTSTTSLEISREGDKIFIHSAQGDFSFREGFSTYKSPGLKLTPPAGRTYLFYGEAGPLPSMRIL